MYILSAQSLLNGHYIDLTSPQRSPEIHFLPGFPALLAPFTALVRPEWNRLKWVPWFLALCAGFLTWSLFRREFSELEACGLLIIFIFNPLTVLVSDVLLSEWWLLCLSLAAFLFIRRLEKKTARRWQQIALASILSWAALTRPEGSLLSISLATMLFFSPSLRKSCGWIVPIPFIVESGWLLRNFFQSGKISTYIEIWHGPGWDHIGGTVLTLVRTSIGLGPVALASWVWLLVPIVGTLQIAALREEYRERASFWRLCLLEYTLLFIGVRFFWPVLDDRFFIPILPMLGMLIFKGLASLPRPTKTIAVFLLFGNLIVQDILATTLQTSRPFDRLPSQTLAFIRERLPPEAVVFTNKGGLLTLYTAHTVGGDLDAQTADDLAYRLLKAKVSYAWIRRQFISDQRIQQEWIQADRWMSGWPAAFPVLYDRPEEGSTLYAFALTPLFVTAYEKYLDARQAWDEEVPKRVWKNWMKLCHSTTTFPVRLMIRRPS